MFEIPFLGSFGVRRKSRSWIESEGAVVQGWLEKRARGTYAWPRAARYTV